MSIIESFSGLPFGRTQTLRDLASDAKGDFILLYTGSHRLEMGLYAEERMTAIAEDTGADMLYADHYRIVSDAQGNEIRKRHPLIDCQKGALRNDFDFGNGPSPTESKKLFYTSVSLLLSRTQGYCYHLSKFHVYMC